MRATDGGTRKGSLFEGLPFREGRAGRSPAASYGSLAEPDEPVKIPGNQSNAWKQISLFRKEGEITTPFTTVKVIEGVFSKEQKVQLIEKITEAMIEVEGEGMRDVTTVVIEEIKQGDWARGGKPVIPKAKTSQAAA